MNPSPLPKTVPALLEDCAVWLAENRLRAAVLQKLTESGYNEIRGLSVECLPGRIVILNGRLPSFYLNQIAQTIAMSVDGVARVRNHIQVD